jgi:hypothetical protein
VKPGGVQTASPNGTAAGSPPGQDPESDSEPARSGRAWWTPTRIVLGLVVVALVSMWIYVLYLAFGPGRQPPIDRLADRAFAVAGEERCAAALRDVDKLPFADESPDATARADVIDQANATFAAMLDDLDRLAVREVPAGDQRRRATEWLADWRTYLADRQYYADRLRTDPGARLLVSPKEGQSAQVTEWIDEFAKANRMPSCVSPGDA